MNYMSNLPKIFKKDKKKPLTPQDNKVELPRFCIKMQNINSGFIFLALQRQELKIVKVNIYALIIFNICFVIHDKQS